MIDIVIMVNKNIFEWFKHVYEHVKFKQLYKV